MGMSITSSASPSSTPALIVTPSARAFYTPWWLYPLLALYIITATLCVLWSMFPRYEMYERASQWVWKTGVGRKMLEVGKGEGEESRRTRESMDDGESRPRVKRDNEGNRERGRSGAGRLRRERSDGRSEMGARGGGVRGLGKRERGMGGREEIEMIDLEREEGGVGIGELGSREERDESSDEHGYETGVGS